MKQIGSEVHLNKMNAALLHSKILVLIFYESGCLKNAGNFITFSQLPAYKILNRPKP
jgi:hypothetical protein